MPSGSSRLCTLSTGYSKLWILLLFTLVWVGPTAGSTLTLVQPPFQVNRKVTAGDQDHPAIAANSDGLFMVTWSSDSDKFREVKGRAYYADGAPWTSEFLVNKTVQTGSQFSPDVDCDGSFNWFVVWPSWEDHGIIRVYSRLYSSLGPHNQIERVMAEPSQLRTRPDVAMFENGDYIAIWSAADLQAWTFHYFVQLFDVVGTALTDPMVINTSECALPPGLATGTPDVCVKTIGGVHQVFAAWKRYHDDGDGAYWADIVGRRFDLHAKTFDDEVVVAPADSGIHQDRPWWT